MTHQHAIACLYYVKYTTHNGIFRDVAPNENILWDFGWGSIANIMLSRNHFLGSSIHPPLAPRKLTYVV